MPETEPNDSACNESAKADRIPPELASTLLALGRKLSSAVAKVNQAQRELGEVKARYAEVIAQITIE